jgi:hypothetical protein
MRETLRAMGYATVASLALGVAIAHAQTPLDTRHKRESVTLDFFLEACTVVGKTAYGKIPHFDCESYIYGVLDSQLAGRASSTGAARTCFPAPIAPWEVYRELDTTITSGQRKQPAADVIVGVLRKKYPCK